MNGCPFSILRMKMFADARTAMKRNPVVFLLSDMNTLRCSETIIVWLRSAAGEYARCAIGQVFVVTVTVPEQV
jgi:hypothetical protein